MQETEEMSRILWFLAWAAELTTVEVLGKFFYRVTHRAPKRHSGRASQLVHPRIDVDLDPCAYSWYSENRWDLSGSQGAGREP